LPEAIVSQSGTLAVKILECFAGGKYMARHYSSKDFFRQMPNALLARYFQGRGLFGDMDFVAMKETKPEELFAAWLALPDGQRKEMDVDFRDIFEMSREKRCYFDES
jgi:hypothetical protein